MAVKEIIVNTNSEGADLVADAFFSLGCQGVKIVDKNDLEEIKNTYWDYIDESAITSFPDYVKVSGFFEESEVLESMDKLKEILGDYGVVFTEIFTADVAEESWYDTWKKYYSPIKAGKFTVVPEWIKYENPEGNIEIKIDPGMAFGTGEHESTKLCLTLMSEVDFSGKRIVDVGTGSGVLGIGAAKAGAEYCLMLDIDSIAVKAAQENTKLNGICGKIDIIKSDLLPDSASGFDIVLANLTADILIRLSKSLTGINARDIICSGIIHSRKNDTASAFEKAGYRIKKEAVMSEWCALWLSKGE